MPNILRKATLIVVCTSLLFFVNSLWAFGCSSGYTCIQSDSHAHGSGMPGPAATGSLHCRAGDISSCCRFAEERPNTSALSSWANNTTPDFQYQMNLSGTVLPANPNLWDSRDVQFSISARAHPLPLYLQNAVWRC